MLHRGSAISFFLPILRLPPAIAQNVATNSLATPTFSGSPVSSFGFSSRPEFTDNATGGSNNDNYEDAQSSNMVNYYFVFLALILCVVALFVILMFRRKSIAARRMHSSREYALQHGHGDGRGGPGWANSNAERRRYWQGRWRSAEASREEGLNEHGEAPPPYVPKTSLEERDRNGAGEAIGPAVPLQTLSREHAGLKPPDYEEAHADEQHRRDGAASAGTSSGAHGGRMGS
ncbi:hypothetical protein LTR37_004420 [Vermiconidia calcicola]|uniref:Uncharacterized protein n=1 Tax=Vermiconidia calcicola TaxID=1690605 RepID=A0ACC3NM22_9PEZI|nr:hypothetical protein LTR37_004420 [Vermiconidia calcicola]